MTHQNTVPRGTPAFAAVALAAALTGGCGDAPSSARSPAAAADASIAEALAAVADDEFSALGRSLWIGTADPRFGGGGPLYREFDETPRPAASSIKTAYLVEFFSDRAAELGEPVPGAAALIGDPSHPAVAHFDSETQAEIREHLEAADAETVGRHMIRGTGVSNPVYNAAANLVTAFLGGPSGLTRRIHTRHPDFGGIESRRYMLAARDVTGDNEVTAASLAAVLAAIARADVPGVSGEIHEAMRRVLFLEKTDHGRHFYKGGSLNSSPITRVLSGFFESPDDPPGRQLVYVFLGELPSPESVAPGDLEPGEAGARLEDYLHALREAALPAARRWLARMEAER